MCLLIISCLTNQCKKSSLAIGIEEKGKLITDNGQVGCLRRGMVTSNRRHPPFLFTERSRALKVHSLGEAIANSEFRMSSLAPSIKHRASSEDPNGAFLPGIYQLSVFPLRRRQVGGISVSFSGACILGIIRGLRLCLHPRLSYVVHLRRTACAVKGNR